MKKIGKKIVNATTNLILLYSMILVICIGCSTPSTDQTSNKSTVDSNKTIITEKISNKPNDESIKKEITSHAEKCTWELKVKNKDIFETYSGQKIKIDTINIIARSLENTEGSVKFILKGKKVGKPDGSKWYIMSYETALPYLSQSFKYEGEWAFKKYDTGWMVNEKPSKQEAYYVR